VAPAQHPREAQRHARLVAGLAWMPSKPISKTCTGSTWRTGPNFWTVWRFTQAVIWRNSASVRPNRPW
jgi:hypothetical protein